MYVEAPLEMTDMVADERFAYQEMQQMQIRSSEKDVRKMMEAFNSFTNSFHTENTDTASTILGTIFEGTP